MRNLALLCTATLLAVSSLAQVQPPRPDNAAKTAVIVDDISIPVPAAWRVAYQTKWVTELRVPRQKDRRIDPMHELEAKGRAKPPLDEARTVIGFETRRSHAEAVQRLGEIAAEQAAPARLTVIAGWPAIERIYTAPAPEPGQNEARDRNTGAILTTFATTAIAAGSTLVRFDTTLQPDADRRWAEEALAMARATRAPEGNVDAAKSDLRDVEAAMKRMPRSAPQPAPEGGTPPNKPPSRGDGKGSAAGIAVQARTSVGELEVAASPDGQHVVVATNTGYSFSDNFGASFTPGGATPCIYGLNCDGDPSLAIGQSGLFYYAWIGYPTGFPGHTDGYTNSLSRSAGTTGHTYTFVSDSVFCAFVGGTCYLPDQEHIAADRFTASSSSQDRVYVAYRHFTDGFTRHARIVCSSDSGATWPSSFDIVGTSDFPRPSVGPDGMVYVGYTSGANMMLHKFSNCDAGLAPQAGFPVTVSAYTAVPCPITGLDRCGVQNTMESPRVAVDELDANHVYYAYATNTSASNDDVMLLDSQTGGSMGSWTRSIAVNTAVAAVRFMPWLSVSGSTAVVDWYDRRTSVSPTLDDRTRFMGGSVRVAGTQLVRGDEIDFSGVDDHQCIGWPCTAFGPAAGTRTVLSSENCPAQPQLAGVCSITGAPCDFSSSVCSGGGTCVTNNGCPKYGDYNGIWAIAARRFSAWASGTPPMAVAGAPAGINVYESADNIPSEFYVRDWTNTATDFDKGTAPSTNPWFWATSDVWNQNTATPPISIPTWLLGDAPVRGGTNEAFARVSRRMTAPFAENVNVHFLFGDYGAGNPFMVIGDAPANFAAGDMTALAHIPWIVASAASIHLCL
ncbi:MAG: hypothetical protein M3P29_09670, partial [Acidobacteriota bacterium]|nr:hypothetical protein [Acidobacteriota bacterium]